MVNSSTSSPKKSLVSTVNGVSPVCLACLSALAEVRGGSVIKLTMRRLVATDSVKIGAILS